MQHLAVTSNHYQLPETNMPSSSTFPEQSKITAEKPLVEQIAVVNIAENGGDLESCAEIEALKAKVAAVKLDEEEWK